MNRKQLQSKLASMNIQRNIGYTNATTLEELKRDVWNACKKQGFEFVRLEVAATSKYDGTSDVRIYCKHPNPSARQQKGEFLVSGGTARPAKRGILKGSIVPCEIYACDLISLKQLHEARKKWSTEFINAIKTVETKYPTLGDQDREEWKRRVDALCSPENPRRHDSRK
jgi:hypothetical protein